MINHVHPFSDAPPDLNPQDPVRVDSIRPVAGRVCPATSTESPGTRPSARPMLTVRILTKSKEPNMSPGKPAMEPSFNIFQPHCIHTPYHRNFQ